MALDAAAPFEVDTPPVEKIPVENIADLQPEAVYALAIANLPQQKVNDYKIKAAEKNSMAARGALYPTLSAFGSLGSRFNSRSEEAISSTLVNPAIGKVNVSGTDYNVFRLTPFPDYTYRKQPFFSQLNQNFNQGNWFKPECTHF